MNEYLPPVVTQLRADLSDLMTGLVTARAAVIAWATGVRDDVNAILSGAGREWGDSFGESFDQATKEHLRRFDRDLDQNFVPRAAANMARAGARSGAEFGTSFMAVAKPLLITLLIAALPALTTMVGAAISLGIGAGFVGLGAFLLREQPALIAAATTLRDTLSSVFKEAATPMLGPMVRALEILTAGAKELGPAFKEIFAGIAPGIPDLATGIVGMFREMMPGLKELAPVIGQLLSALGGILPDVGKGLGDLFSSLAESGPAMIALVTEYGKEFGHLLSILGDVIKFFADIFLWLKDLRDMAQAGGWDTPWEAWATGLEKAWNWIKKVAGAIGDWFSGLLSDAEGVGTSIGDTVKGWVDKAGDFIQGLLDRIQNLPGQIVDGLAKIPGLVGDLAMKAFDGLMYWSGYAVASVIRFFDTLPERLGILATRTWNFVKERFQWGVTTAIEIVRNLPGQIWNFFQDMGTKSLAAAEALWNGLVAWGERVYQGMVAWVSNTADSVVAWFEALPERIGNAVETVISSIKKFFSNAGEWLLEAGKDLVRGLVSGIMAAVDAAVEAIRRAMDRIRRGAKDALGISSPSKVFAELGRNTMEGYEQGVNDGSDSARDAVRRGTAPPPAPALAALAMGAAGRGPGGSAEGTTMVHATINIDGQRAIEALVPAAQRRKQRTGQTGLS